MDFLKIACDSDRLILDGTFRVVPSIFSQLYILHSKYIGQVRDAIILLLLFCKEIFNKQTLTISEFPAVVLLSSGKDEGVLY